MRRLSFTFFTSLTLAAPAAAALSEDARTCLSLYKPEYEASWALDQATWEHDCRRGFKGDEVLRHRQKLFIEDCRKRYAPQAAKLGETDFSLYALCARGAAGERQLASRAAPPPPPPDEPKNAWQRIYALARWKGNRAQVSFRRDRGVEHYKQFDFSTIRVEVAMPPEGTVDKGYQAPNSCWISTNHCPDHRCDAIPGFDKDAFALSFEDVGCKGALSSLRWEREKEDWFRERQAKTRSWLDDAKFERVGRAYEDWLRGVYQLDKK